MKKNILKGAEPIKYKIIERDSFQVVGIKREFSLVNGENLVGIPKLWDEVNEDGTVDLLLKLNNGQIKGVLGVCVTNSGTQSKQVMDYWVATEYDGDTPDGLLKFEVPASKWLYLKFMGQCQMLCRRHGTKFFQNSFHPVVMSMQAHQH
ncbi:GyrI-like domain-containing protein [Parageobacillus toebii]|uniref:GyrI-like domain-containing protein n=1 Tax=Parageobacillus toebii TaxID=153151 RepID=UPI002E1E4978|nr:effector binding domain-containing protein [Parageobacillus toebii]